MYHIEPLNEEVRLSSLCLYDKFTLYDNEFKLVAKNEIDGFAQVGDIYENVARIALTTKVRKASTDLKSFESLNFGNAFQFVTTSISPKRTWIKVGSTQAMHITPTGTDFTTCTLDAEVIKVGVLKERVL